MITRRMLLAGGGGLLVLERRASAATALRQVKAAGVLRIATTGANKPYTFAGEGTELQGYDIDWGRAIAAGLDVRPEFIRLDWKGILPGLIAHQFDCALSAVRVTPERAAAFDFSAPYGTDDVTVAVRAGNTAVHGIEDLQGLRVAAADQA